MTKFLSERLRAEGRQINAFGGYNDLQELLDETASRLEYLEYRNIHLNAILAHVRDMNRELGLSMSGVASMLSEAVEEVLA